MDIECMKRPTRDYWCFDFFWRFLTGRSTPNFHQKFTKFSFLIFVRFSKYSPSSSEYQACLIFEWYKPIVLFLMCFFKSPSSGFLKVLWFHHFITEKYGGIVRQFTSKDGPEEYYQHLLTSRPGPERSYGSISGISSGPGFGHFQHIIFFYLAS